MTTRRISINRAPVLTMWGAMVAERLGYDRESALTLGKAVAGLNAQAKGQRLGIYEKPEGDAAKPRKAAPVKADTVHLLGREIPVRNVDPGVRAVVNDRVEDPAYTNRYLDQKFGADRAAAEAAMRALAQSFTVEELSHMGFALYEEFRPTVPDGVRGWGAKGELDLGLIHRMAGGRGED